MPLRLPSRDDLPDGPLRRLVTELHHLYRHAGYPGIKKISKEIQDRDDLPDVVSHETVRKILQGEVVPRWSKLESLVRVLAGWSVDRPVVGREAKRFQELWHAAGGVQAGGGSDESPATIAIAALPIVQEALVEPGGTEAAEERELIVEREQASLSYNDGYYRCVIERALFNGMHVPVTRYPIEIRVDRYPDEPDLSNQHHRAHPLTWEELDLAAACDGEPMRCEPFTDRDALKEVWLLFENQNARFPLYPGQRTTISYGWTVGDDKWGSWFQRAIRRPTRRLGVEISFPAHLDVAAWGTRSSLWNNDDPLYTPIRQALSAEGRRVFSWYTERPSLQDRYTIAWRFRNVLSSDPSSLPES